MMSVMAVVFSALFKQELTSFAIFLFAGMIPWGYFNSVTVQSSNAFISNEGLIKKIYIPKIIFPIAIAIALLIDSILSFVALFLIVMVVGGKLSWALMFLPISYALIFVFSAGVALIASVLTVFFRDLQYVLNIALQGLFFLTPVLYKHDSLSGALGLLVKFNPLTPFIELFRAPLYRGELPQLQMLLQALLLSGAVFFLGVAYYVKQRKKLVFRL